MGDFVFEEAETLFKHGAIAGIAGSLEIAEDSSALEMEIFELSLLFEFGWGLGSLLGETLAFFEQVLRVVGIFGSPASCHRINTWGRCGRFPWGPAMDLGMGESVSTLQRKLVAALPVEQRQSATRMSRCFHLDAPGWYQDTDRPRHLPAVTDAVLHDQRIRVRYSSWERESTKTLEPLGLVLKGGRWYLVATSTRPRNNPSTYRVDQIVGMTVLDQRFERPDDFDLAEYWNGSIQSFKERLRSGTAVIHVSVDGSEHYRQLTGERPLVVGEPVDGRSTAIVPMESIAHAHGLLLQLGAEVEVIEPVELRAAMATTARALTTLYGLTA